MRPLIRRQIFGTLSYAEAARSPNGMRAQRVTQSRTFLADRFQLGGVHGEWLPSTRYAVTNRKCYRGAGGGGGGQAGAGGEGMGGGEDGVRAGVDPERRRSDVKSTSTGNSTKTDNSVNFSVYVRSNCVISETRERSPDPFSPAPRPSHPLRSPYFCRGIINLGI